MNELPQAFILHSTGGGKLQYFRATATHAWAARQKFDAAGSDASVCRAGRARQSFNHLAHQRRCDLLCHA